MSKRTVFTIGHSTHPIEEFIEMLRAFDIELLVDVRTVPKSRHNPQFNSDALRDSLALVGIGYRHMKVLGGLRRPNKESINGAWRNDAFRGFADYMQTPEFEAGLEELMRLSEKQRTAIMCSEAVPWRCHRSLIGDALLVRGIEVVDIMSKSGSKEHSVTPWAVVEGTRVTYPG